MRKKDIFLGTGLLLLIAVLVLAFLKREENPSAADIKPWNTPGELIDESNERLDFSAFNGKVVFVNNWASWCAPCIAEMPSIAALKDKLKDEDVVFVMVSFDENPEKAFSFVQRRNFDFDIYFPGQNYPYGTPSIPSTFVIDKSGNVVSQQIGMADYNDEAIAEKLRSLARQG